MKEKPQTEAPRPQKVLLVITKSNFGGAQRYVFELATRLVSDGYEVAVALGGEGALKDKLINASIPVFPIDAAQRDVNITKEIKVLWNLFRIIEDWQPDIVHLNSPKIGGLGVVAGKMANFINLVINTLKFTIRSKDKKNLVKKIVYTNHGWPFKEPRPEWQLVLIRMFSWLTVFLNHKTVVLSETEKRDVKSWPFIKNKLVVIPNGISPFDVYEKNEALEKILAKVTDSPAEPIIKKWQEDGTTVIGTISELHKNKGLTFAIEGIESYIKQYPDKKLMFIIIGEGEERTMLKNLIAEKSLQNIVILAGHIDEAREYLSAFDVFLLSSVKEGMPFAILEAGYVGIPVISTSVGGIPETITNLENGLLIPPRRPQEIKNALLYLDEHGDIKKKMAKEFKSRITKIYNFDIIVEKIKFLYSTK